MESLKRKLFGIRSKEEVSHIPRNSQFLKYTHLCTYTHNACIEWKTMRSRPKIESFAYFRVASTFLPRKKIKHRLDSEWWEMYDENEYEKLKPRKRKSEKRSEWRLKKWKKNKEKLKHIEEAPSLILHDARIHVFQSRCFSSSMLISLLLKTVLLLLLLLLLFFFVCCLFRSQSNRRCREYIVYITLACARASARPVHHKANNFLYNTRCWSSVRFHFEFPSYARYMLSSKKDFSVAAVFFAPLFLIEKVI